MPDLGLALCMIGQTKGENMRTTGMFQFPAVALIGLSLGKTVYSILPQSTQLKNGYQALKRQG